MGKKKNGEASEKKKKADTAAFSRTHFRHHPFPSFPSKWRFASEKSKLGIFGLPIIPFVSVGFV